MDKFILQISFFFLNLLLFKNYGSQRMQAKCMVKANWFFSNP